MARLSIKYTLQESLKCLALERDFFVSTLIGPILIIISEGVLIRWLTKQGATGPLLGALAILTIMFLSIMLAVRWHRLILLEEESGSLVQVWIWKMRHTWYFLYFLFIGILVAFLIFVAHYIFTAVDAHLSDLPEWLRLILTTLMRVTTWLMAAYVMMRLSLILPATAIDRGPGTDWVDWAWSQSHGNEWPLMVLVGVVPLFGWAVVTFITTILRAAAAQGAAPLYASMIGLSWGLVYFAMIFQVTLLSVCLKQLLASEIQGDPVTVEAQRQG